MSAWRNGNLLTCAHSLARSSPACLSAKNQPTDPTTNHRPTSIISQNILQKRLYHKFESHMMWRHNTHTHSWCRPVDCLAAFLPAWIVSMNMPHPDPKPMWSPLNCWLCTAHTTHAGPATSAAALDDDRTGRKQWQSYDHRDGVNNDNTDNPRQWTRSFATGHWKFVKLFLGNK